MVVLARSGEVGVRAGRHGVPAGKNPGPLPCSPFSPVVESSILAQSTDEGDDNGEPGMDDIRYSRALALRERQCEHRLGFAEQSAELVACGLMRPVQSAIGQRIRESIAVLEARRHPVDGVGDLAPSPWSWGGGIMKRV